MSALLMAQVAAKYPGLLSLSDMANLKANQLNESHLVRIGKAFGVELPVSEELLSALVALLKGKNLNEVADLVKSPEAIEEIVTFVRGGFKDSLELYRARREIAQAEIVSTQDDAGSDAAALSFSFAS